MVEYFEYSSRNTLYARHT